MRGSITVRLVSSLTELDCKKYWIQTRQIGDQPYSYFPPMVSINGKHLIQRLLWSFLNLIFFKQYVILGLFSVYFGLFKQTLQFLQQIYV